MFVRDVLLEWEILGGNPLNCDFVVGELVDPNPCGFSVFPNENPEENPPNNIEKNS